MAEEKKYEEATEERSVTAFTDKEERSKSDEQSAAELRQIVLNIHELSALTVELNRIRETMKGKSRAELCAKWRGMEKTIRRILTLTESKDTWEDLTLMLSKTTGVPIEELQTN